MIAPNSKCVWIDLDNSPHVPLFKPIIDELNRRGYATMVTARDCFQVCALADLHHLAYKKIGTHHGKNKLVKVIGLFYRAAQLLPTIISKKPIMTLSHGSRSQLILSKVLRIPSVMMDDYEPSKGLPLLGPDWIIMPEVIPDSASKLPREFVLKYPGIKEDVYVPFFKPNPSILKDLNIPDNRLLVVLRPPATEAHYHNPESEVLFKGVVDFLKNKEGVRITLLPRTEKQGCLAREAWPDLFKQGRIIIPPHVVNGLNLIWHADLVISGGGTMNREAAALGVPVYSIFRGTIGAVDKYLAKAGRLTLLESLEDVEQKIVLVRRDRREGLKPRNNATLTSIVDSIELIIRHIGNAQKSDPTGVFP